jgi:hypothetical protein
LIVLNDMPGQLCNRIWAFAHFIAFGAERGVFVVVPFFGEYVTLFPNTRRIRGVYFVPLAGLRYRRLVNLFFRAMRRMSEVLPAVVADRLHIERDHWGTETWPPSVLGSRGHIVFLSGWSHRKPLPDLRPWRDKLCTLLRPCDESCRKVEDVFARNRREGTKVVGIHIRRGDYKDFAGGRFYFEPKHYARWMRQIAAQLDYAVSFLICSNENIEADAFDGLPIFQIPTANSVEDLYALSLCDLIVGPSSTFSMWASFYGQVPIHLLSNGNEIIDIERCEPFVGYNRYASGRQYHYADDLHQEFKRLNFAQ